MINLSNQNNVVAQCFDAPSSGATVNLTTAAGVSVQAQLAPGVYRIYTTADIHFAAGAVATATDTFLPAGSVEYFSFSGAVSVFDAVGGNAVQMTLMPSSTR